MIDFLGKRYLLFFVSFSLIAGGVVAYVVNGGFRYHIDFVGGTELRTTFNEKTDISDLRNAVTKSGFEESVIQSVGDTGQDFIVTLAEQSNDVEDRFARKVSRALKADFKITSVEHVGAAAGQEVRWNALISVLLSMLILLGYIAVRSRFSYAVGAIAALVHDLLAVLSFLLIAKISVSLNVLAAILALLGYSLNDTLVIYHRIRECSARYGSRKSAAEIVNISLNETLRRTLLTSLSTLLALLALVVIGGDAFQGFALTMFAAVIVGTYSSVYIASPVMLAFGGSKKL
jgi:preprotein translocase subunit SecF